MNLTAKRIFLRPLDVTDAHVLFEQTQDETLRYLTSTTATFSIEQIEQHILSIQADATRHDFAICLTSDEMIGECSILDIDLDSGIAGFRISLRALPWTGQGYGTEAIACIFRFCFEELQLGQLELEVFSHNERAIAAYKKAGFQIIEMIPDALLYDGVLFDKIIIVFGVCNFALSYLCLYYATILSSAAIVTLIFSLKVILTPIALRLFLKETLHARVWVGGCFGIIGVGVLIVPSLNSIHGLTDLKGVSIALVGTLLTSVGDASSARNAKQRINPVQANAIGFTVASLLMSAIVWYQGTPLTLPTTFTYLSALLYLTVIASFLAWLFYLKLVERVGGAKSGYMVALFPVIGGIASVMIGESTPSLYLLFGCLSSCLGAAIALGIGVSRQRRNAIPDTADKIG